MENERILIALPENEDKNSVSRILRQKGYDVTFKRKGQEVLNYVKNDLPLVILMDYNLKSKNGWEVSKELKSDQLTQNVGVILHCEINEENEIIHAFEMGADDVIHAENSVREIVARVDALIRRLKNGHNRIKVRDLEIDLDAHRVKKDGEPIDLTYIQFKLLYLLASRRESIFSRTEILERVWGKKVYVTNRTVDVHIKRLREKLGEIRYPSNYIQTIHGVGYRFI